MSFIDEDYVNIVPQDLLERSIRLREEYGIYAIAWRFDDVMEVLKIARDAYPRRRSISPKRR